MVGAAIVAAPSAQASGFGVESLQAGTCAIAGCTAPSIVENPAQAFTQASGYPPYVVGSFELNSVKHGPNQTEWEPIGEIKSLRIDLPAGMSVDPQAVPQCPVAVFESAETRCPTASQVGELEVLGPSFLTPVPVQIYNISPPGGTPVELGFFTKGVIGENVIGYGHLSWHQEAAVPTATGDFHGYIEATGIPTTDIRGLTWRFDSRTHGGFIQMPSECASSMVWHVRATSYTGEVSELSQPTSTGVTGCGRAPFAPMFTTTPGPAAEGTETQSDAPDGVTVSLAVPQQAQPTELATAATKQITVALPEGLTINPAAADAVATCSDSEFGISEPAPAAEPAVVAETEGAAAPITCGNRSKIGSFQVESPDLAEPLTGTVYLGSPLSQSPESGQEYRILLAAEATRAGVGVRLVGDISANATSGRLRATVQTPQIPFSAATIRLDGGPEALLANPLACGRAESEGVFTPFGGVSSPGAMASLTVTGCQPTLPFTPSQSTQDHYLQAGAPTSFSIGFSREQGQPYLSQLTTTLPEGLLGDIASVPTLCPEAQANAGQCPLASLVGTVGTTVGSGPNPLAVPATSESPGAVYLTGAYDGAPYGLSMVVNAEHVGQFRLGTVVARATISLDPYTARVSIAAVKSYAIAGGHTTEFSGLPTVVGGVPVRLRALNISLQRPGFVVNPTSCQPLETESSLGGVVSALSPVTATAAPVTGFAVAHCGALAFSPHISATSATPTSRAAGASLIVNLDPVPGQANLKEVILTLPSQLVARLAQLQRACTGAQFAADPAGCPEASQVATGTLTTPLLPGTLTGAGYLVSHGGAFPDLDFVLEGDGVRLIEVGHTAIKQGITSVTFASLPDAPFTSFTAGLPLGPNALLAANASLCTRAVTAHSRELVLDHGVLTSVLHTTRRQVPLALAIPTTFIAQDGATTERPADVAVSGCSGKSAVSAASLFSPLVRVHGATASVTVAVPGSGRVTIAGTGVTPESKRAKGAGRVTVTVGVSAQAARTLRAKGHVTASVHVAFKPALASQSPLSAVTKVTFGRRPPAA